MREGKLVGTQERNSEKFSLSIFPLKIKKQILWWIDSNKNCELEGN